MLMDALESGESYLKDGVPIRTTWGQTLFRHYYESLWVSANPYVLPSTLNWGSQESSSHGGRCSSNEVCMRSLVYHKHTVNFFY